MPDNSTKVAEPVTSREVAEKIAPDWQVVFDAVGFDIMDIVMDFQAGRKSAGQTMDRISDFAVAAINSARADLARKMIEAVKQSNSAEGWQPTSGDIVAASRVLKAVARAHGIEI